MNSSLILFVAIFSGFDYINATKCQEVRKRNNRNDPYVTIKREKPSESKENDFKNKNPQYKILCPTEFMAEQWKIETASKDNYLFKYCLFEKDFNVDEDISCKHEVKPVLKALIADEKARKCGDSNQYPVYGHSYLNCGKIEGLSHIEKVRIKMHYTYQICYNGKEKEILWTEHDVETSHLFQNPTLNTEEIPAGTEISTTPYFIDDNFFTDLKDEYESEQKKDKSQPGTFVMVPQPIVPAEHYVYTVSKKTTNHYINRAPLWEKLVPLVKAIDEGIKKLRFVSKRATKIYTKVTKRNTASEYSSEWYNLSLFDGNIWYKFVYQTYQKQGVFIVIYNTPNNPPAEGCGLGKKINCDFKKWTTDEEIRQNIDSTDKQYAFCCTVESKHIKEIFHLEINVEKYLDIDDFIVEKKIPKTVGIKFQK